jgi:hypothetical protein
VLADYLGGDGGVERGRGRASSIGMGLVTWKRGGVLGREVEGYDGIYLGEPRHDTKGETPLHDDAETRDECEDCLLLYGLSLHWMLSRTATEPEHIIARDSAASDTGLVGGR